MGIQSRNAVQDIESSISCSFPPGISRAWRLALSCEDVSTPPSLYVETGLAETWQEDSLKLRRCRIVVAEFHTKFAFTLSTRP